MNKFRAILYDSFLEIKSGKMLYLYGAVMLIMVLIFILVPSIKINGENLFESGILSPGMITRGMAHFFSGFWGFALFLMVFGSAWLLPAYLGKGRIELTLSKPISRMKLLSMKFATVFLVKISILALMSIIIWLAIALRLGAFSMQFFFGLFFSFLVFANIYALVFFIGVLSRSGALAVMGYFVIKFSTDLLAGRELVYGFLGDSSWKTVLDTAYQILPKIGEMDDNYISLISGDGFTNTYAIWTTLAFSAIIFLLTLLIFHRRDY
ncbi:MAG: hypothetical protein JSV44_11535 [Candidatus Zixiibacteriota bacterium]|nr:MAG: hypothetical protein JSV44_11535 [candidate division Zixibacteria bacterium]